MSPENVFEGYSPKIKKAIEITSTERGIDNYADILGFPNSESFLKALPNGALLLDIGAGKEGLKKELAIARPDLKVLSINPSLADRYHRRLFSSPGAVIGLNPFLPIESNSIDCVVDNVASIYYNEDSDERILRDYILEIIRVLKPGASAFVGPSYVFPDKDFGGIGKIGSILNSIESVTWQKKDAHFGTSGDVCWRAFHIYKK